MNTFNFEEFKAPVTVNKRKESSLPTKFQEYDNLKYRKMQNKKGEIKGLFYVATKLFESLNLETNGLTHFVHPTNNKVILLGLVDEKDAKYLKKRKDRDKGKTFKSEALEAALNAAGIIDSSALKKNQFIDLTKVGENVTLDGIAVKVAFQLVVGKKKEAPDAKAEIKAEGEVPATATAPTSQAEVPAQPASEESW